MMLDYEVYETVVDLLDNEDLTIEQIAEIAHVTIEEVQYVDHVEHDDL